MKTKDFLIFFVKTSLNMVIAIDYFINARLNVAGRRPTALTDDWAFLRRASLDANGVDASTATPVQLAP